MSRVVPSILPDRPATVIEVLAGRAFRSFFGSGDRVDGGLHAQPDVSHVSCGAPTKICPLSMVYCFRLGLNSFTRPFWQLKPVSFAVRLRRRGMRVHLGADVVR